VGYKEILSGASVVVVVGAAGQYGLGRFAGEVWRGREKGEALGDVGG